MKVLRSTEWRKQKERDKERIRGIFNKRIEKKEKNERKV